VLTAAAEGQFAHGGLISEFGQRRGVFTFALLESLRKGDTNGDGVLSLSELVAYVQGRVPKLAAEFGGAGRASIGAAEPVKGRQTARFGSRG
jgi:hypothetical protein